MDKEVTQSATLKSHLMGLSSLTPIDPKDIASELGMTEKYVTQLLDRLEYAMVEWRDGVLVRMEDPFDPDPPGEVLRRGSGGSGPDERSGRTFHSRRPGAKE